MNKIVCEETYYKGAWCRAILYGLKSELKRRRAEYEILFEISDIDEGDSIFVIGSNNNWMRKTVYQCNQSNVTPIVIFNQLNHIIEGHYHSVSSDINGMICTIAQWLNDNNKSNICLYGVNPLSIADISRSKSYMESFSDGYTFYNKGSLKKCFDDFINSGKEFDAVICTNDFAAISLVKHLIKYDEEKLKDLEIISCSQTKLSGFFAEYIKSVNINFESFGINAYNISRLCLRSENISEISITIKWNMDLEITNKSEQAILQNEDIDYFYNDEELFAMLNLNKMIENSDENDKFIVNSILEGKTYSQIADNCFVSEQSVKYRVKNYISLCKVKNRTELLELLREYRVKL